PQSVKSSVDIFRIGMNFENTIEYIESKILDAFFGYICRQGEWDLAEQYLLNVKEWCQMLKTTANFELTFLPKSLQDNIINLVKNLEKGIESLLKTISKKDFEVANKELEKILKIIRELYKIRE
ncbi:MAG: hypothetical protein ACTSYB_02075, partial [Candidatus Helarchaeota archaeon]